MHWLDTIGLHAWKYIYGINMAAILSHREFYSSPVLDVPLRYFTFIIEEYNVLKKERAMQCVTLLGLAGKARKSEETRNLASA